MSTEQIVIDSSALETLLTLKTAAIAERQIGATHHLILPPSYQALNITGAVENAEPCPTRKRGTVKLANLGSFIRYCKDQPYNTEGYIYADPEATMLTAVFNDHQGEEPGWRDFRAVFEAEKSRELAIWLVHNKKVMEQEEFAIFLEDNIADITEPSGETLLAIALTMQAKVDVNFSSSKRLDNGQVQLAYTETIDARAGSGSITIPAQFAIGVRLFKNGEGWKLKARLKYRLGSGKVKFWYELDRPENVIEEAFTAYVEQVMGAGYPVLIGKP